MDDNCGEWVESIGVASGWNLWVWLECIGVVSGCGCKEAYRYPHNNYYFSLLNLYWFFFWQQHPYFFVHFLNVFSFFTNSAALTALHIELQKYMDNPYKLNMQSFHQFKDI